jgi:hypothetical protein
VASSRSWRANTERLQCLENLQSHQQPTDFGLHCTTLLGKNRTSLLFSGSYGTRVKALYFITWFEFYLGLDEDERMDRNGVTINGAMFCSRSYHSRAKVPVLQELFGSFISTGEHKVESNECHSLGDDTY